ncbi:hypothetical protein TNCV_3651581 [Trichonephila clavipes]|uniref:Uncharacterized protein n=1 Tax=Trichonephila clavipes TaxID=2585209 RepID=A0A8X6S4J9_TRICX|nr:hypothetical protein TNCV_3651581 [Trichonephila clavipes]
MQGRTATSWTLSQEVGFFAAQQTAPSSVGSITMEGSVSGGTSPVCIGPGVMVWTAIGYTNIPGTASVTFLRS